MKKRTGRKRSIEHAYNENEGMAVETQNCVVVQSPIAILRHFAKNLLQSLYVDSSARGTECVGSVGYKQPQSGHRCVARK